MSTRGADAQAYWLSAPGRGEIRPVTLPAPGQGDVVVRAMWDAILSSTRWFPPLGDCDPESIGSELATFFLAGIRRPAKAQARASARSLSTR